MKGREPAPPPPAERVEVAEPPLTNAKWERIELVPGLELFVRDVPGLRKLARQIVADYKPPPA